MHSISVPGAISAVTVWRVRTLACLLCAGLLGVLSPHARAEDPDPSQSFYVPQAGLIAYPLEGEYAVKFFHACPNNDDVSSLPNNARIQITLVGASGPISGYPASKVYVLFNGGTEVQNFTGPGADSVIANSQWNYVPLCPDLRKLTADAPTDQEGRTYITFQGASAIPGVGQRDPSRKWGRYDSDIPVYVEFSDGTMQPLVGRLTQGDSPGSYVLRIKSFDWTAGLGPTYNAGEAVTSTDFNGVATGIGVNNEISY